MAKNSPSATAKLTPSTARTSPKRRTTFSNWTAGVMGLGGVWWAILRCQKLDPISGIT